MGTRRDIGITCSSQCNIFTGILDRQIAKTHDKTPSSIITPTEATPTFRSSGENIHYREIKSLGATASTFMHAAGGKDPVTYVRNEKLDITSRTSKIHKPFKDYN
jgi:hypothetical protein